jgi:uncharacterized protein (DUF927 family)
MTPAEIRRVAAAALVRGEEIARHYLPDGKRQAEEWVALNPRRADAHTGSFKLNLTTGRWADFADDSKGGDLVSWLAYLTGTTQGAAARELADHLGMDISRHPPKTAGAAGTTGTKRKSSPKSRQLDDPAAFPVGGDTAGAVGTPGTLPEGPMVPIPASPAAQLVASPPHHPRHGAPVAVWVYRDADGRALFGVCRFNDTSKGKQILPLTWHFGGWRWKGLSAPRPLYNLDRLAARPDAPVIVAEGELAADAAGRLFPDCVATTSPNGAQAAARADWTPLRGRRVRIWPDHDAAGRGYAADVARRARQAGAIDVELLDVESLAVSPETGGVLKLPAGWDAADAEADGWTPDALAVRARFGPMTGGNTDADDKLPRYELRDDGLYYLGMAYNRSTRSHEPTPPQWICSPLRVAAVTRDLSGEAWGRMLEFEDLDGVLHRWAMPMSMLRADGQEVRGELLRQGLRIASGPEARRRLTDYLMEARPTVHARCVTSTGWHDGGTACFVLPDRTLGEQTEPVYFQAETLEANPYRARGSLDDWREHVAALCAGNSRLVFGVCVGFAAALLGPAGAESGGFHLRGGSSGGKTTVLRVACSAWGGPTYLERWRATDNALESVAALHSDTLLVLDELAQLDPRVAGESAYLLAAGQAKRRATREAGLRAAKTWRLLFLSSGEISLADHAATAGRRLHAGADLRLADIPADAGVGLGLFECLHGRADGHVYTRDLAEAAEHYYGTAGPAFVESVIKRRHALPQLLGVLRSGFLQEAVPAGASGQVARVADRFALVAAAGELATDAGITGWPDGEAERAARRCFRDWMRARGGAGAAEESALLRQVRGFVEQHAESRFTVWERADDDHARRTAYRAGFSRQESDAGGITLYCLPEVFRSDVIAGFDRREAERVLMARGWLRPGPDGRATRKERLPTFGKSVRCYVMPLDAMTDDTPGDDADQPEET